MATSTYIIIMAVCLVLSAYFSATETAFSSVNTTKLKALAEKGNKKAALACRLEEQYGKLISTVLIGNNIVNIAMASLGTVIFVRQYGDSGATISTVVVTVVVLIFGEISPKSIAKDCAEQFTMFSAPFIQFLIWVFTPLNFLFSLWKKLLAKLFCLNPDSRMSQEELLMLVDEVQQDGSIDKNEGELLKNAIEFSEQEAQDILVHRVDLAALPVGSSPEEIAAMFSETKHSRLLVYEGSIDNIIGVLYLNHYFKALLDDPDADLRKLLMEPCYVYKTTKLPAVLETLKRAKQHLAIVTDEYGGCLGLITMEDVLEQIVGDIWDETDEIENEVVERASGEYELDGDMAIDDFTELVGLDDEAFETESATVGGWTLEMFGTYPQEGQSFKYENLTVTVLKMDGLRVEKVLVQVHPERKDEED